ncbi:hypothetical protein [Nannocystis sp.]|uniref:hypothetical protein n=1 Tax=Nannocystis sp. TaxID=1962667 RepID=UPI00242826A7|nr:hypothetical protein [Nannocystis sp.]MBK7824279.1 hypothetical protein [Nannocystis sp.]MBK9755293.1 hypothetical protein [Nannocystis sp.]
MTDPASDPLDRLYAYAAWMLGDRQLALDAVRSAVASGSAGPLAPRLAALRTAVFAHAAVRKSTPASVRERLDDTLRLGTSVALRLGPTALRSGVRRLPVLLTSFMQSCLIAAVQSLPPTQREAFVLLVVLGLPEPEVITLQGDTPRGFSSVKTRMLQSLEGYLEPRCGHLHPQNPCQCPNRLQLALDQCFVQLPEHEEPSDAYPSGSFAGLREMFAALPPLRLAATVRAGLA